MPTISVLLTPVDVALFRESRAFDQGATQLRSELPNPGTTAGALRTYLLRQLAPEALAALRRLGKSRKIPIVDVLRQSWPANNPHQWILDAAFRGPFLHSDQTFFPAPFSLVQHKSNQNIDIQVLWPLTTQPPSYTQRSDAPSLRPLWYTGMDQYERLGEGTYIQRDPLANGLLMGESTLPISCLCEGNTLPFLRETRLGIGVDWNTGAAKESQIYTVDFLRLQRTAHFRVEIEVPDGPALTAIQQTITQSPRLRLGGEARWARIAISPHPDSVPEPTAWPPVSGRFFTYLATPGFFQGGEGGWFPKGFAERFTLVGAAVGEAQLVSSWDIAAGRPTPARSSVRGGAIYFWESQPGCPWGEDPHNKSLCDDPTDAQAGWGICYRGEWNQ